MSRPRMAAPEVNCIGKDKLHSMNLAREVAKKVSARRDASIAPYKCLHCGYYHVGNLDTSNRSKFYGRPKKR